MKKAELVELVQEYLKDENIAVSKPDATLMVDAVTAAIVVGLTSGEEIKLAGLGRFGVVERSARTIKVFGETKEVEASRAAKFYPAPALRAQLNGG